MYSTSLNRFLCRNQRYAFFFSKKRLAEFYLGEALINFILEIFYAYLVFEVPLFDLPTQHSLQLR